MFRIILVLLFSSTYLSLFAQTNQEAFNDPQVREKYVLFGDNYKAENYAVAQEYLHWLIKKHPDLSKTLYTKGIKLYEGLIEKTEDAGQVKAYQDSVLSLFDQRIQHFQEEGKVLNLKGYRAYLYYYNRPEKKDELFDLYEKIVRLNGNATLNQNIGTYMHLLCEVKEDRENIDDEKIVEIHGQLSQIIQFNLQKYREAQKPVYVDAWEKTQVYIDSQLESCVDINCELLKEKFLPKYRANPNDSLLVQKIIRLGLLGKCYQEAFLVELMESQLNQNSTFKDYKNIAILYEAQGQKDKYLSFMEKAFAKGGSKTEEANFYLELASEASQKGQLNTAREYALKAKNIDPNKSSQVYNFIGQLYYLSGEVCKSSDPEKAAVFNAVAYLAAYEMFEKAGNTQMMAKAQQYFPTAGQIHTLTMTQEIGQQIPVGCWIGGTTTLRKR